MCYSKYITNMTVFITLPDLFNGVTEEVIGRHQ